MKILNLQSLCSLSTLQTISHFQDRTLVTVLSPETACATRTQRSPAGQLPRPPLSRPRLLLGAPPAPHPGGGPLHQASLNINPIFAYFALIVLPLSLKKSIIPNFKYCLIFHNLRNHRKHNSPHQNSEALHPSQALPSKRKLELLYRYSGRFLAFVSVKLIEGTKCHYIGNNCSYKFDFQIYCWDKM